MFRLLIQPKTTLQPLEQKSEFHTMGARGLVFRASLISNTQKSGQAQVEAASGPEGRQYR